MKFWVCLFVLLFLQVEARGIISSRGGGSRGGGSRSSPSPKVVPSGGKTPATKATSKGWQSGTTNWASSRPMTYRGYNYAGFLPEFFIFYWIVWYTPHSSTPQPPSMNQTTLPSCSQDDLNSYDPCAQSYLNGTQFLELQFQKDGANASEAFCAALSVDLQLWAAGCIPYCNDGNQISQRYFQTCQGTYGDILNGTCQTNCTHLMLEGLKSNDSSEIGVKDWHLLILTFLVLLVIS